MPNYYHLHSIVDFEQRQTRTLKENSVRVMTKLALVKISGYTVFHDKNAPKQ